MRLTFKFFNMRVGFFIEKRFSFLSFFNRIEFNKNYNEFKNIEPYNVAGTLFKESLDRILKTNPYLHEYIFRSFKKDKLFKKLLENLD